MATHSKREARTLEKVARVLRRPDLADAADALLTADVDLATVVTVAAEYDKLAPALTDAAKPLVLHELVEIGATHGARGVRQLTEEILARHSEMGEFEDHRERCRRFISLSPRQETKSGLFKYELVVDNEGAAVLEAAIGPLSAPRPDPETGVADARSSSRRRGEALIEALRRSAIATTSTGAGPAPRATLMVTMSLDDLQRQVNAAVVLGTVAQGTLLAPDTARKIACDAGVIPTVLGADGALLDQGSRQRLFTPDQRRALCLRDGHCTFGTCDAPASWCDAHHLTHWVDGGPTDLDNAALLCPRHHTIVHTQRLAATVVAGQVLWDERPGSYRAAADRPTAGRRTPGSGSVDRPRSIAVTRDREMPGPAQRETR